MRPRDRGTIVQVGSALGYRAIPLQSAYCGAKHAINGFTESVRCELLHDGSRVRITIVQMPAVNTPQFSWVLSRLPRHPQPVPPIYQPEVAAQGSSSRPTIRIARSTGSARPRSARSWPRSSPPRCSTGTSPAPATTRSRRRAGRPGPADQPLAAGRPAARQRPGAHGDFDDQSHQRSAAAQRHRARRAGRRRGPPGLRHAAGAARPPGARPSSSQADAQARRPCPGRGSAVTGQDPTPGVTQLPRARSTAQPTTSQASRRP